MTEAATVEHDLSQTPAGMEPVGDIVVVDSTNKEAYVNSKLKLAPVADDSEPDDKPADKNVTAPKDAASAVAVVEPKEGDTNAEGEMFLHGEWHGPRSFPYRLHKATEAKDKEAAAKVAEAAADAKNAREQLAKTERERNELKQKYEPPKSDEIGPEPLPEQFSDVHEYRKAIKDWAADAAVKEERQNVARQTAAKSWETRQAETKKELPDYAEKISNSDVRVSDQLRDAIVESEIGPKILYHLAENPDVAVALGSMTVARMLREVGKLEATLGGTAKPAPKSDEKAPTTTVAEISKAPAPITPLRGASAPVSNGLAPDGQFYGTFEQYEALRKSGKIK